MKIEVGQSYRTRDGRKARIVKGNGTDDYPYSGMVHGPNGGTGHVWHGGDGYWTDRLVESHLDLISSWEDSKMEDKSESKMDVKEGDRVLVEAVVSRVSLDGVKVKTDDVNCVWVKRASIKSVELALPGVGDTVTSSDGLTPYTVGEIKGEWLVMWNPNGVPLPIMASDFKRHWRIVKRAEDNK